MTTERCLWIIAPVREDAPTNFNGTRLSTSLLGAHILSSRGENLVWNRTRSKGELNEILPRSYQGREIPHPLKSSNPRLALVFISCSRKLPRFLSFQRKDSLHSTKSFARQEERDSLQNGETLTATSPFAAGGFHQISKNARAFSSHKPVLNLNAISLLPSRAVLSTLFSQLDGSRRYGNRKGRSAVPRGMLTVRLSVWRILCIPRALFSLLPMSGPNIKCRKAYGSLLSAFPFISSSRSMHWKYFPAVFPHFAFSNFAVRGQGEGNGEWKKPEPDPSILSRKSFGGPYEFHQFFLQSDALTLSI